MMDMLFQSMLYQFFFFLFFDVLLVVCTDGTRARMEISSSVENDEGQIVPFIPSILKQMPTSSIILWSRDR